MISARIWSWSVGILKTEAPAFWTPGYYYRHKQFQDEQEQHQWAIYKYNTEL